MKLAIMQPYLFPYIGYFQLINAVDKFVIYDDVAFINKGWINRNNILINGKKNLFTVPLKDASQNIIIKDIYFSNEDKWKKKILKTLELAYKKAPYFNIVYPLILNIILNPEKKLSKYIFESLILINGYLGINTEIIESSSLYNNSNLKAQERILDICIMENANTYINPIGGIEIYSKQLFCSKDILINFIKSTNFSYKQFNNEFVPWLSIIDLLMFNSVKALQNSLTKYELI